MLLSATPNNEKSQEKQSKTLLGTHMKEKKSQPMIFLHCWTFWTLKERWRTTSLCRSSQRTSQRTRQANPFVAVAHTQHGDIPGKAFENTCWYPYEGKEHTTSDFSWLVQPSVRNSRCPKPEGLGCPHGVQNDGAGDVYVAIARQTLYGDIPGKAQGNICWYGYKGKEYSTNDFYWVAGHAHLEKAVRPRNPTLAFQMDHGPVWPAIANTKWGTIPGKACGDSCLFPYGGKEHLTKDFDYVIPYAPYQ